MIYFQQVSKNSINFVKYDLLQFKKLLCFCMHAVLVLNIIILFSLLILPLGLFISSWWLLLLLAYLMSMAIPLQQRLPQTIYLWFCNYLHPRMFTFGASFGILYWACYYRNTLCQICQNQCCLVYWRIFASLDLGELTIVFTRFGNIRTVMQMGQHITSYCTPDDIMCLPWAFVIVKVWSLGALWFQGSPASGNVR